MHSLNDHFSHLSSLQRGFALQVHPETEDIDNPDESSETEQAPAYQSLSVLRREDLNPFAETVSFLFGRIHSHAVQTLHQKAFQANPRCAHRRPGC